MNLRHGFTKNQIKMIEDLSKNLGTNFNTEVVAALEKNISKFRKGSKKDKLIYTTFRIDDSVDVSLSKLAKKHKIPKAEVIRILLSADFPSED